MNRAEAFLTAILLFVVGTACTANELLQFTPGVVDSSSNFARSVAINSTYALIGDPRQGTASLYDLQSGDLVSTLRSSVPRDEFGAKLVLTDQYAVVAASNSDLEVQTDVGKEVLRDVGRVFVYDASTWQLIHELLPDEPTEKAVFGFSLDVYEDTLVVGSPWLSQSAYVFDLNSGEQVHKLVPEQILTVDERFGRSVAVSGNRVLVGAPDYRSNEDGSAYVFDLVTGEQLDKLVPSDVRARPSFGDDVAIDEDLVVVGEFPNVGGHNGRGVVEVFDLANDERIGVLLPDSAKSQFFGTPLDLSGDNVIIGAHHDADSAQNSGSAYVFNARTGTLVQKFVGEEADDEFGISVDIQGNRAIIGAWGADVGGMNSVGKAYLFTVPEPSGTTLLCSALIVVLIFRKQCRKGD